MEWIKDFYQSFGNDPHLKSLKENGFHGSVTLNFSDGVVHNYDVKLHGRVNAMYTASNATVAFYNSDGSGDLTLTKGGGNGS